MAGKKKGATGVPGRTETIVSQDGEFEITHVDLHSPLPEQFPAHPAGIDHIGYIRYRLVENGEAAADPDAILIMQPGNFVASYEFDNVARCTLKAAARKGRRVEFWALSRRGEGATDNTGIAAAQAAGNPDIAVDYYYRGLEIDGRVFEGFQPSSAMPHLAELGYRQIVADTHELLVREIPDAAVSRRKVFLGGHSGGCVVAGVFGATDFDGVPGHELVAGFIGLDTPVVADMGQRSTMPWLGKLTAPATGAAAALHRWQVRRLRAGTATRHFWFMPEMSYLVRILGLYAHLRPTEESYALREISEIAARTRGSRAFVRALRLVPATTWRQALFGRPDPLGFRLTNEAALGLIVATGLTPQPVRVSMGELDGPVRTRSFPMPPIAWRLPRVLRYPITFALGDRPLVTPVGGNRLYGWRSEVSPEHPVDVRDVARMFVGGPLGCLEPYHTRRYVVDQLAILAGVRDGEFADIKHERGLIGKPMINLFEGRVPLAPRLPLYLGETHVIGNYSHADVSMASWREDGSEPISDHLSEFLVAHTDGARSGSAHTDSAPRSARKRVENV